MPTPVFQDAGAGAASTTTTLSVPYPATVNAGDFLLLQMFCKFGTAFTATGWTSITSVATSRPGLAQAFYKYAAGTEGGTSQNFSLTGSPASGWFGRIYRLTSVVASSPSEGAATATATSTTIPDTGVTTSGSSRLAANLVFICDDLAVGPFTGMTGGTWAEPLAEYTTPHATLQLQTAAIASAGTINGGSTTVGAASAPGSNEYAVIGFALKPASGVTLGLPTETDTALAITPVKSISGLHATLGLPSETDTARAITAAKTSPDVTCYMGIDFGSGFEDVSARVRSLTCTHGRPFNLDVVEAGTMNATLSNADGFLDPSCLTSPWFGRIIPLLPIRVLRRKDGNTYELFSGPIERWIPTWAPPLYQDMGIEAADSFESLAAFQIVSGFSTLTTSLTGTNNDLVFTATDAGGPGDAISVTYVVAGTNTALDASTNTPTSGSTQFKIKSTATSVRGQPYGAPAVGSGTPNQALQIAVSGSDITITVATGAGGAATSTANDIIGICTSTPEIAALVTAALAPGNNGTGVVTAMGQTFLFGGKWPQEKTGARINRILDLAGWSAGLRDIDTGQTDVVARGPALADNANALAHIQDTADSELGYVFMTGAGVFTYHDGAHRATATRSITSQATFSDDGVTGFTYVQIDPSFDKDKIVNQASVTSGLDQATAQVADDTYSQTGLGAPPANATAVPPKGNGLRSLSRSTQLALDGDALSQAQQIVAAYAYPAYRFDSIKTIEPSDPTKASAWVQAVLGLEMGDLVTLQTTPPATGTTTSYDAFVESIQDDVAPGQPWARTLKLTANSQTTSGGGGGGGGTPGAMLNHAGGVLILDDAVEGVIV